MRASTHAFRHRIRRADFAVPTHMVEVVERGNGGHANGVSDAVKAAGAGPGLGGR